MFFRFDWGSNRLMWIGFDNGQPMGIDIPTLQSLGWNDDVSPRELTAAYRNSLPRADASPLAPMPNVTGRRIR